MKLMSRPVVILLTFNKMIELASEQLELVP